MLSLLFEWLEEVGVDEGEEHHADAFDLDDDVFVFADALDEAFVAFEGTAGDTHFLVLSEIFFGEDLASRSVVGCQELQQADGGFGDDLDAVVGRVTVYPEGDRQLGVGASGSFELDGVVFGGLDEEDSRDDSPLAFVFRRGFSVGAVGLCFGDHCFGWEIDFFAEGFEELFCFEILPGLDGKPFGGVNG